METRENYLKQAKEVATRLKPGTRVWIPFMMAEIVESYVVCDEEIDYLHTKMVLPDGREFKWSTPTFFYRLVELSEEVGFAVVYLGGYIIADRRINGEKR